MATIEKEKALDVVRQMVADGQVSQEVAEKYFTELKESEDERIREALIKYLDALDDNEIRYGVSFKDMHTWLEKQGEHANFRNKIQIGDKVTRNKDGVLVNLSQLKRVAKKDEKQGEQKPAEWSSEQKHTLQTDNVSYKSSTDAHLWTRAIGFDGEPMESKQAEQKPINTDYISGIRKELLSIEDNAENINGLTESQWVAIRAAHRLLGECIAKEQTSAAWNEEDKKKLSDILALLWGGVNHHYNAPDLSTWLKSLKDRVQPQQKQEWSYNDKIIIETIIQEIEKIPSEEFIDNAKCRCLDWLRYRTKSLRPQSQWKPSDKQMDAIDYVKNFDYGGYKDMLVSLYYDLKKLREE